MTVIELAVASFVLGVAIIGVVGGLTFGMTMVGGSRQRSAGSTVALERLERVHNLAFDQVALYEQPVHAGDPISPDNAVTTDNTAYRVDGSTTEELVVDSSAGALKHIDDPLTLGKTTFAVYQYVTWATPGVQKRVVVVVTWKYPVESATTNRITHSTLIGPGTVTVPGVTPTPGPSTDPSPEASPTPVPSATPTPTCDPADVTGPAGENDGIQPLSGAGAEQGYTNSTSVQIRLLATDACGPISAELSNDAENFAVVSSSLASGTASTVSWTISESEGAKTIYGRFRDAFGNLSATYTATVVLDSTPPSAPTSLQVAECGFVGQNRKVTLTWSASADTNLFGYRLYRSINSSDFQSVKTTDTLSVTDTAKADHGSVRYLVRAYDKAGTESGDSDVITFSKNNC